MSDGPRSPEENGAYDRWRTAAVALQAAHAAYKRAEKEHALALQALGNVVAPPLPAE